MALRDEITPYVDGNGLVAPNTGTWAPGQGGSDNGPMFTSEFYVMLKKLGQDLPSDYADFDNFIGHCINPQGMLARVPYPQVDGQEGPDDYYGVLNACMQLGNTRIPRKLLWATIRYLGFLNNDSPGTKTGASFLIRQPQLLACMIAAAFPSRWNPIHLAIKGPARVLFLISALIIATSCIGAPASDTDARRLSWHLGQCLSKQSLLCFLAFKVWKSRLYKTYGPDGMKAVAAIYYQVGHPFAKYWVTE